MCSSLLSGFITHTLMGTIHAHHRPATKHITTTTKAFHDLQDDIYFQVTWRELQQAWSPKKPHAECINTPSSNFQLLLWAVLWGAEQQQLLRDALISASNFKQRKDHVMPWDKRERLPLKWKRGTHFRSWNLASKKSLKLKYESAFKNIIRQISNQTEQLAGGLISEEDSRGSYHYWKKAKKALFRVKTTSDPKYSMEIHFFSCIFHEKTSPISLVLSSSAEAPTWSVLHWEGQEIAWWLSSMMQAMAPSLGDIQSTFGSFGKLFDPAWSQLSEPCSREAAKVLLLHQSCWNRVSILFAHYNIHAGNTFHFLALS